MSEVWTLNDMKGCFYEALIKREKSFLSTTLSVRLRLFQNWNSQCCKCQAFITHNLFISLHIKLVNVLLCCVRAIRDACRRRWWMIAQVFFPCAQLRSPAVAHEVFSCRYCYRMCSSSSSKKKTRDEQSERGETKNLTPNSCQISRSFIQIPCVCASYF